MTTDSNGTSSVEATVAADLTTASAAAAGSAKPNNKPVLKGIIGQGTKLVGGVGEAFRTNILERDAVKRDLQMEDAEAANWSSIMGRRSTAATTITSTTTTNSTTTNRPSPSLFSRPFMAQQQQQELSAAAIGGSRGIHDYYRAQDLLSESTRARDRSSPSSSTRHTGTSPLSYHQRDSPSSGNADEEDIYPSNPEQLPLLASEMSPSYPNSSSNDDISSISAGAWKQKCYRILSCLNPLRIIIALLRFIFLQSTLGITVTFCAIAWILFYGFGNPSWDAIPVKGVSLSRWFNFIGRQLLMFELARFTQYVFVDVLVLSTTFGQTIISPLVRFIFVQSKGYPFVTVMWSLWDFILLQGSFPFQQNWLYWTGISIYSSANPGGYMIDDEWYTRILSCGLVVGAATIGKRTIVRMQFGKRNVAAYKPTMERVLNEIVILAEVADLARTVRTNDPMTTEGDGLALLSKKKRPTHIKLKNIQFNDESAPGVEEDNVSDPEEDPFDASTSSMEQKPKAAPRRLLSRMKSKLDSWDDARISDKLSNMKDDISLDDILKFRQARDVMTTAYPFSDQFGKASTRDEMIESAQDLYTDLLKLTNEKSKTLPYAVLEPIAIDNNGNINKRKSATMKSLFRADRNGNLTMLSFVQPCDWVYRRLRFFQASVENSSVIDKQIEGIINSCFRFVLLMVVLSLLKFNPYALLVSLSTLLLTTAFAVGPSAAKAIQGLLMIVGRRPFDIGDRIVLDTVGAAGNGISRSWFVEDINLFVSTLRYAATGEIASIPNSSIAESRITNLSRTKSSIVLIELLFHLSFHDDDKVEKYYEQLDDYCRSKPQIWDGINFFRCEDIDSDKEVCSYKLSVRCRISWQNAKRVFGQRGDLLKYAVSLARKMNVACDVPPSPHVLYAGGSVSPSFKGYGRDQFLPPNVEPGLQMKKIS